MSALFEFGFMVNKKQQKQKKYLNLNKYSLVLEPAKSLFCFNFLFEDSTRYMNRGDLPSLSSTYTLEISHTGVAQHRLRFHDKGQGKLE
jgi:hypothetical protein